MYVVDLYVFLEEIMINPVNNDSGLYNMITDQLERGFLNQIVSQDKNDIIDNILRNNPDKCLVIASTEQQKNRYLKMGMEAGSPKDKIIHLTTQAAMIDDLITNANAKFKRVYKEGERYDIDEDTDIMKFYSEKFDKSIGTRILNRLDTIEYIIFESIDLMTLIEVLKKEATVTMRYYDKMYTEGFCITRNYLLFTIIYRMIQYCKTVCSVSTQPFNKYFAEKFDTTKYFNYKVINVHGERSSFTNYDLGSVDLDNVSYRNVPVQYKCLSNEKSCDVTPYSNTKNTYLPKYLDPNHGDKTDESKYLSSILFDNVTERTDLFNFYEIISPIGSGKSTVIDNVINSYNETTPTYNEDGGYSRNTTKILHITAPVAIGVDGVYTFKDDTFHKHYLTVNKGERYECYNKNARKMSASILCILISNAISEEYRIKSKLVRNRDRANDDEFFREVVYNGVIKRYCRKYCNHIILTVEELERTMRFLTTMWFDNILGKNDVKVNAAYIFAMFLKGVSICAKDVYTFSSTPLNNYIKDKYKLKTLTLFYNDFNTTLSLSEYVTKYHMSYRETVDSVCSMTTQHVNSNKKVLIHKKDLNFKDIVHINKSLSSLRVLFVTICTNMKTDGNDQYINVLHNIHDDNVIDAPEYKDMTFATYPSCKFGSLNGDVYRGDAFKYFDVIVVDEFSAYDQAVDTVYENPEVINIINVDDIQDCIVTEYNMEYDLDYVACMYDRHESSYIDASDIHSATVFNKSIPRVLNTLYSEELSV